MTPSDEEHMAQALVLARRGLGLTWPNPSVGSIVVTADGELVGRGWTAPGGRPHAEAVALEHAGAKTEGGTIYVTLEPCAHEGRGLACADAIVAAKPARAVIALRDPDPRTAGRGIARLKDAGIAVEEGVLTAEAASVALGHLMRVMHGRPAVTLKLAVGADGLVPQGQGQPVWITGPDARAHGHLLRSRSDAILVGRGTILSDDPSLTCRLPGMSCRSPIRVVLDRRLRTPPEAKLFDDMMVPVWLICAEGENLANAEPLQERGAEIVPVPVDDHGLIEVRDALETLAARGITRVLVEGGPSVARAFLDADLVDEAVIYQGPSSVGADGLMPFAGDGLDRLTGSRDFTKVASRAFGPDRMTLWRRMRTCSLALSAA
ncbi:MAG: bifunctional diaminohydroxyphosphoribosylaminopyrimidine deaminase/5-amino-6-(5-phosphoribosylamino)uracil reductase RibD [Methyloceanibacter sp.]|uniref:bifunctional diaminohydroxyphosphoribosylaminopyrimidine deaminase/5-amino-6-(5-phosphoribosylamino)uracil reductase RibD n=1 Tax=Methyloceanibacter sp. TaxID=1965321 RepID=UPI003D6CF1B1